MAKQSVLVLAVVITFGILLPWYKGLDFLDPVMIVAYSCMGVLFVAPASAEAFAAASREVSSASETLKGIATVLAYGWGITVLILAAGIGTVNVSHWHGSILAPPPTLLASSLLLGLTACWFVAGACALLARKLSVRSVKGLIRLVFLVLLAGLAFSNRFLAQQTQTAIAARMTTEGLTHFAFLTSAVLALGGAGLVAAVPLFPMKAESESC
jgi:hypothetical protein